MAEIRTTRREDKDRTKNLRGKICKNLVTDYQKIIMENRAVTISTAVEAASASHHSSQLADLANSRIQAVKSLATILLKEIELLETLTPKTNDVLRDENFSLAQSVEHFETELIRTALIQAKGIQRKAARLLGTKVTTLNMKMKRYGINHREFTLFDSKYNN